MKGFCLKWGQPILEVSVATPQPDKVLSIRFLLPYNRIDSSLFTMTETMNGHHAFQTTLFSNCKSV